MQAQNPDRVIRGEIVVQATVDAVWDAWTTEEGIKTFFAPACNVDLRVDGWYEIFFDPDAPPGQKGGEGMRILAFQPKKMLSFTWNAPPDLSNVRKQRTHVVIRFQQLARGRTRLSLTHDGWGEGEEWDRAFTYFSRAWNEIVLPRLKRRFAAGPIDWENLSKVSSR
jgi:uncharacterized protein YndB with AHSA1/START domain